MPTRDPNETILATGWRITGRGAARVAEQASAYAAERLRPGREVDTLYAVQCTMNPIIDARPAVERVLEAITDEVRQSWTDCPRLLRDTPVSHAPSRFGGFQLEAVADPGREWVGEVMWRAVHPVVAGAPITTHVLLEERPTYVRLSVRVTADNGVASVRGAVGAGQAQPPFLRRVAQDAVLSWMGAPVNAFTLTQPGEVEDFVWSVLGAEQRDVPVVMLAPLEEGDYVVPVAELLLDLLGRAQLYVMRDHRLTFRLTDTIRDRRMSAYWGAAHAYMPGWSPHDDPLDHPLLVADRLADPVIRAKWLGELGMFTGQQLRFPQTLEERRAPPPAERVPEAAAVVTDSRVVSDDVAAGSPAHATHESDATLPDAPASQSELVPLLAAVMDEIRGLGAMVGRLNEEVERLRTISAVRASSTSSIERRLGRLEELLEQAFPRGDVHAAATDAANEAAFEEEQPPGLVEVVQDAAETWSDALVFLEEAYESAAQSPYEDPERVRAVFGAMARIARRRRDGSLGTALRDAFADFGIDYRAAIARSTSARLRRQYRFAHGSGTIEAEEHIVLGNTYDPRRCLRIYFTSRLSNEPRFVIGHVGRHFEVMTTT